MRACIECGRPSPGTRCADHERIFKRTQNAKRIGYGTSTRYWQTLSRQAKERDGYRCRGCGTTHDLTVHIRPELEGNHRTAKLEDCETLCRRCHGAVDGGRAVDKDGGGVVTRRGERSPASPSQRPRFLIS
jgi:5-methylcytosine-specific restriction endonuclease McrA